MRPWLLALALVLAPRCLPPAAAQGPPLGSPPPVWEVPPPPPATAPAPEDQPAPALGQQGALGMDLLLGLPTGVRVSWAVLRHEDRSFMLEGLAGLYIIVPMAGVGGRFSWTAYSGQCNALVLRPGVDAYAAAVPVFGFGLGGGGLWGVGGDVEFLWLHQSGRRRCELGLDLGVIAVRGDSWGAVPLVSLVAGYHF